MGKKNYIIKFNNGLYLGNFGVVRIKEYARLFTEPEAVKMQARLAEKQETVTLEPAEGVSQ